MIDENIQSGDLIIFEKTQQLNNGDVGCFGIEDNIATCKKYFNDSKQNVLIQLADIVAGSIRRDFEKTTPDSCVYRKIIRKREEDTWEFQ